MTKRAKARHITSADVIKIHARLSDVCFKHEIDDGTFYYRSGYTDIRLAEELGVPTSGVARVRNENFGPLRRVSQPKKNGFSDENYRACVARIRRIEEYLDNLDPKWSHDLPLPADLSTVEGF